MADKYLDCDTNAALPIEALFAALLTQDPDGCPALRVASSTDAKADFVECDINYQNVMDYFRQLLILDADGKPALNLVHSGPVIAPSYTVVTLPLAANYPGGMVYVTDESGGPVVAYSDATNWRRVSDGAIVS